MSVALHRTHNIGPLADVDAGKTIPAVSGPVTDLGMTTPVGRVGIAVDDRSGRGGSSAKVGGRTGLQNLTADVPLEQMVGYASDLRSATQGRATFSTQFDHNVPVQSAASKEGVRGARGF
jgi:elongation factor G